MLYCHVTGINEIVFLYEFKANQDFKAFTVRYQASLIQSRIESALEVKTAMETGATVKRPQWAQDEDNATCKACPYRTVCWHL
jgi:CRISPR/Cas system-associated exonuclease Cas4 (RecB family)